MGTDRFFRLMTVFKALLCNKVLILWFVQGSDIGLLIAQAISIISLIGFCTFSAGTQALSLLRHRNSTTVMNRWGDWRVSFRGALCCIIIIEALTLLVMAGKLVTDVRQAFQQVPLGTVLFVPDAYTFVFMALVNEVQLTATQAAQTP